MTMLRWMGWEECWLLAAVLTACGGGSESSASANGTTDGGTSAVAGGAGGSSATTTDSGSGSGGVSATTAGGSSSTTATAGGGGTGGAEEINVPRTVESSGPSVLDEPEDGPALSDGLCTGVAVYCNGRCIDTEGDAEGNCSVLKLGLGQTSQIEIGPDALYYAARNTEILKMDLASELHESLVTGLTFVRAMRLDGDSLYFTTDDQETTFDKHVRHVSTLGGTQTALSPSSLSPAEWIEPLTDRLLLGYGDFAPYRMSTIPKTGGALEAFGEVRAGWIAIDGDNMYYNDDGYLMVTSLSAPETQTELNEGFTNSRFALYEGSLYHVYDDVYRRVPVDGGPAEEILTLEAGTRLYMGIVGAALLVRPDYENEEVEHLMTMPIEGGDVEELVAIEDSELQDVAANDTHVFLVIGQAHAGGLLKVER